MARYKISGSAGSTGGGLGGSGGGTGGSGGGTGFCNAPETQFMPKCAFVGCHDATSIGNADLDMSAAGLAGRLLGKMPTGMKNSDCGSVGKPYLVPGSDPAEGLLLDKLFLDQLSQPCGNKMPVGPALLPNEEACVRDWAKGVTTGAIAP